MKIDDTQCLHIESVLVGELDQLVANFCRFRTVNVYLMIGPLFLYKLIVIKSLECFKLNFKTHYEPLQTFRAEFHDFFDCALVLRFAEDDEGALGAEPLVFSPEEVICEYN